jgi:hypothetical protein
VIKYIRRHLMPISKDDVWKQFEEGFENEKKQGEKNYWKFGGDEEGEKTLRLLMPNTKNGEKLPYFRIAVHYLNMKTFLCPNQTLLTKDGDAHEAETCPICAQSKKLYNSSERGSENWNLAGQLRARDVFYYRGIIREDKDPSTVHFILLPTGVHNSLIEKFKSKRYGIIFDYDAGRDIVLKKTGKGIKSKYDFDILDEKPITTSKEELRKILEGLTTKNYNELVSFSTKDVLISELKTMLNGDDSDDIISTTKTTKPIDTPLSETKKVEEVSSEQSIEDMLNELGVGK